MLVVIGFAMTFVLPGISALITRQRINRNDNPCQGETQATTTAPARAEESTTFAGNASRTLIMTAAVICIFMAAIESTVVATAMPTIVSQLGDFHLFSWVFSAYLLTQSVSIPFAGRFADLVRPQADYLLRPRPCFWSARRPAAWRRTC